MFLKKLHLKRNLLVMTLCTLFVLAIVPAALFAVPTTIPTPTPTVTGLPATFAEGSATNDVVVSIAVESSDSEPLTIYCDFYRGSTVVGSFSKSGTAIADDPAASPAVFTYTAAELNTLSPGAYTIKYSSDPGTDNIAIPETTAASFAVTAAPVANSVTVSPGTATVAKGQTQQFTANTTTGSTTQAFIWSVDGTDSTISSSGLLSVGNNETKRQLTVTATSTTNVNLTGTATVSVTDAVPAGFEGSSTFMAGSGKDLVFVVEGKEPILFGALRINGNPLGAAQYSVTEGSTVITIYSSYLDTLAAGSYTLVVQFTDGTVVNSVFTVSGIGIPQSGF